MNSIIKSAFLALSLATAGLAVSAPAASAAGIELQLGTNGVIIRDNNGRHDDRNRHNGWNNGRQQTRDACSPQRALNKAERMGVHRARLTDANRRTVTVRGVKRGHRVNVVFANTSSCPVLGSR
ncbi:hypothetical protein DFR52_103165 [Hoeflea marina]|uniref:YpeB-like protein with protease inhibitory function n=1 Tax=Hoeflea marina TaxID=274592 RepID=A0A317PJY6_9HYPH|nr:hypothetical protein [Hoeflea marina]PWV99964.1 hypothetical protein DFR52_103165 [Hoeflea marina]